jgi:Tfp pilus assembly protein PilO
MNIGELKNWSERQQVLAIILIAGGAIFALGFFLLSPMNKKRRELEEKVELMRSNLDRGGYLLDNRVLEERMRREEQRYRSLHKEWIATVDRLDAFPGRDEVRSEHINHIDFKVALLDVRQRLAKKSARLGIKLPHDLGIDEAVHSTEDPRMRLLQLRTVEQLSDLVLGLGIKELRTIEPLAAIQHREESKGGVFLEEYPVKVEFRGGLESLFSLFRAVYEEEHVFALRHIRIEAERGEKKNLICITAVMSSLMFSTDKNNLIPEPAPVKKRYRRPLGH